MKQVWAVIVLLLVLAVLVQMPARAAEKTAKDRPSGALTEASSITATVVEINPKYRTVVLKGPKGGLVEMQVGEEARNFDQLKVGDLVTVENSQSVALEVRKSTGAPVHKETTTMTRAKLGEKPGGTKHTTGIMTVKVENINYETREVSLRLPEGNIMNLTVGPQVKRLNEIHKGDEVVVEYTSIVTISVKKP